MIDVATSEEIKKIMTSCGIEICGAVCFEKIKDRLIPCSGLKRLPKNPKAVISALFPYNTGEKSGNLSKYTVPMDYHDIVSSMLNDAVSKLQPIYWNNHFAAFCDASPIPEVETARLCGLGDIGRNGLLIHPVYGSFVFIGEIVTDLPVSEPENPGGECIGCGACVKACPSGALSSTSFNKENCVSRLTQLKRELSGEETAVLKKAGSIWGCDICQNVCPLNKKATITPIGAFRQNLKPTITAEELCDPEFLNKNSGRAFLWKGIKPLQRNLRILSGTSEDNKA